MIPPDQESTIWPGANYADASLSCLNYHCFPSSGIASKHCTRTRRNDAARRTSPYRTRQLIKYLDRRRVWREYKMLWRTANSRYPQSQPAEIVPKTLLQILSPKDIFASNQAWA